MRYNKNRYFTTFLAFLALFAYLFVILLDRQDFTNFLESRLFTTEILLSAVALLTSVLAGLGSVFLKHKLDERLGEKQIFIAYSRKDKARAQAIYEFLKKAGLNPWIDIFDIYPGDNWKKVIENALEESAAILVLLSDNTEHNSAGHFGEEVKKALNVAKIESNTLSSVIPVRLTDSPLPKELSDIQAVDLFDDKNHEQEYKRLLEGLERLLKIKT